MNPPSPTTTARATMDAASLIAAYHGQLLRMLSDATGRHSQGLSQAAKVARVPSLLRRRLQRLEIAFHITRHVTTAYLDQLARDVEDHMPPATSVPQAAGAYAPAEPQSLNADTATPEAAPTANKNHSDRRLHWRMPTADEKCDWRTPVVSDPRDEPLLGCTPEAETGVSHRRRLRRTRSVHEGVATADLRQTVMDLTAALAARAASLEAKLAAVVEPPSTVLCSSPRSPPPPAGFRLDGEQAGRANIIELQVLRTSMQADVQDACTRVPVRTRAEGRLTDPIDDARCAAQYLTDDFGYNLHKVACTVAPAVSEAVYTALRDHNFIAETPT